MLIGYACVSKSDGSQLLDLQQDALLKAGVDPKYIYQDGALVEQNPSTIKLRASIYHKPKH